MSVSLNGPNYHRRQQNRMFELNELLEVMKDIGMSKGDILREVNNVFDDNKEDIAERKGVHK